MKMKTNKRNWNVHGINLIPSDSIYQKIQKAIDEENVTQEYLQKVTGHRGPIFIDIPRRTIQFSDL